ncbi:LamB/YcsF family protein [Corynebacterium heidelbergense]|uniref:5-oxoprolinase subunit A n=1 Tax=Corynebacterium heidelbergense TaxID=2055947 RepID=A0A364V4F6_9CORY|nr:5-oxoprolinase subunit PxpA [Corynebacterium heidelbergense]RAV31525.1 LamB/YcsF family protein [Corynebacterium heidelbergense]
MRIDLNADLGETTAGNPVSDDRAMLEIISSANVACGFHAGDAHSIARTLELAARCGVSVGAHVAYRDAPGFGRRFMDYAPAELADEILYQIGALEALAASRGTSVRYVKPHGALYNAIVHHEAQAQAVVDALVAHGGELALVTLPGSVVGAKAADAGIEVVREAFADRAYTPEGTLVSRRTPGAVIHEPEVVAQRVLQMAQDGVVEAVDGSRVAVDAQTVCVHGDSPGAVQMARAIADLLRRSGVEIASFR